MAGDQNCLVKLSRSIDGGLQKGFARLGLAIGRRPWTTVAISMLFAFACISGVTQMESESRAEKLWTPQDTDSLRRSNLVSSFWTASPRTSTFFLLAKDGGDMLRPTHVKESIMLSKMIEDVWAKEKNKEFPDGRNWTWPVICQKRGPVCYKESIGEEVWSDDAAAVPASTAEVLTAIANADLPSKFFASALGGATFDSAGALSGAELIRIKLQIQNQKYLLDGEDVDPPGVAWETKLLDMIIGAELEYIKVSSYTPTFRREEGSTAIRGDLGLIAGSIGLIMFYLVFNFSSCNAVASKALLAGGALLTVGLSLGVGYGLGSLISVNTPVHNVLPFLVMGIGVDDIFVIMNEFNLTKPKKGDKYKPDIPHRVSEALKHAGASITVTSITDFLAFTISSSTVLPALGSFCIWAAISVLAAFVLSCTLFVALMTLDAKRQEKLNRDCCMSICCGKGKLPEKESGDECMNKVATAYANRLLTPVCKAISLVVFAIFLAVSIWSVLDLKQDFRPEWFIPADSELQEYFELEDKYFADAGLPVTLYAQSLSAQTNENRLLGMTTILDTNSHVNQKLPKIDWHEEFTAYLAASSTTAASLNQTEFDSTLDTFLTASPQQRSNIIFGDDPNALQNIRITKLTGFFKGVNTAAQELEAMKSIVDVTDKLNDDLNLGQDGIFAFSFPFTSWEQYDIIPKEAMQNIGLTCLCVFLVVLIFIASPLIAIFVTAMVGSCLLNILGFMTQWGVDLNGISVINLVLAIGLSVDYSVHIAHAFMHKHGTRNERANQSITEMGVSVMNGAFSTFLAVCLLSLSKSYVFSVFFKMFFLTCAFGVLHGLCYLPVVLSLLGPSAHPEHELNPTPVQEIVLKSVEPEVAEADKEARPSSIELDAADDNKYTLERNPSS